MQQQMPHENVATFTMARVQQVVEEKSGIHHDNGSSTCLEKLYCAYSLLPANFLTQLVPKKSTPQGNLRGSFEGRLLQAE